MGKKSRRPNRAAKKPRQPEEAAPLEPPVSQGPNTIEEAEKQSDHHQIHNEEALNCTYASLEVEEESESGEFTGEATERETEHHEFMNSIPPTMNDFLGIDLTQGETGQSQAPGLSGMSTEEEAERERRRIELFSDFGCKLLNTNKKQEPNEEGISRSSECHKSDEQMSRQICFLRAYQTYGIEGLNTKCFYCKKEEENLGHSLRKCSGCECTYYCDQECFKKDWQMHKRECAIFKNKKAEWKSSEKETMKTLGITSKTKHRAERKRQTEFLEGPKGANKALLYLAGWLEDTKQGRELTGLENPANESVFIVHGSSAAVFQESPFEELTCVCVVTLTPLDYFAPGYLAPGHWVGGEPGALLAGMFNREEGIDTLASWDDQKAFGVHCSFVPFPYASVDLPDSLKADPFSGAAKEWRGKVRKFSECAASICAINAASPMSKKMVIQNMSRTPYDWDGLAKSGEFRQWVANKTWGVIKCETDKNIKKAKGNMVTFFVNYSLVGETVQNFLNSKVAGAILD